LTYLSQHVCGGSLIADDIILSAAHCSAYFDGIEIGRFNLNDETETFELFNIEKFENHPRYKLGGDSPELDNDFMILKVYGWSSKNPIQLNKNQTVPSTAKPKLNVAGWGVISTTSEEMSNILMEVAVNYITNKQCESIEGYFDGFSDKFSLNEQISDSMLCAKGFNKDACQGDSGGPLVIKGSNPSEDVQVGVVSWGLGCAHNIFPGIYARISNEYDWIRNIVCEWAENPPESFECPNLEPETEVNEGDNLQIPVTMEIRLDRYSSETGWLLKSGQGSYAYAPLGVYKGSENQIVLSTVDLDADKDYTLIMLDSFGDGINFDGGYYRLWRGKEPNQGKPLVSGAKYTHSIEHKFFFPKVVTKTPTPAPLTFIDAAIPKLDTTTPTLVPTFSRPFITIAIKLDDYPNATSWAVSNVEDKDIIATKPFGSYAGRNHALIIEKVYLRPQTEVPTQYLFAIFDKDRDGLCCSHGPGFYQGYLGSISEGNILFEGEKFGHIDQFSFLV